MFESSTGEKLIPRIEDKILSRVEAFDSLPQSTKYLVAGIGSFITTVVTEAVHDTTAVSFACLAVTAGYLGRSQRISGEDIPTITLED